ncbi:Hypothetical protein CINCED_3A011164 [Cinara cedri]|uniref:Uncharacterized protein n=1 Tax=Cinara cedri TaxID=506608 RepID=A0A5E4NPX3_9HEMI|nr:Hypothetical protein CINCED_3A011164 [Cinara cedri]
MSNNVNPSEYVNPSVLQSSHRLLTYYIPSYKRTEPSKTFLSTVGESCQRDELFSCTTTNVAPVHTNHKSVSCLVREQYFDIIREIELLTNDPLLNFEEKITKLLEIWENCCCKLKINNLHDYETRIFTHYAISESTILLFQREWEHIEDHIKNQFLTIVVQVVSFFEININSEVLKALNHFVDIINNPWGILPDLSIEKRTRLMEFSDFVNKEKGAIIANRVKVLFHNQQLNQAFNLAEMSVYLYEKHLTEHENIILFREEDYECCRDILFSLLMYCDRKHIIRIIETLNPMYEGKRLCIEYYDRIKCLSTLAKQDRPNNYPNIVRFCEISITLIMNKSFQKKFESRFIEFCELMRYWCDIVFLLKKFELFSNLSDPFYKQSILNFIEWAPSADHLFSMADIFYAKFGKSLHRHFYVNIYTRALTLYLDKTNYYILDDQKENALISAGICRKRYLKFGEIFDDVLLVNRECVLTAYQLMPSTDLIKKMENLAIQSGITKPNNSKGTENSSETTKKNNIILDKEYYYKCLCLSRRDCTTLIHSTLKNLEPEFDTNTINKLLKILRSPRMECFNWDLLWPDLKIQIDMYYDKLDEMKSRSMMACDHLGLTCHFFGEYKDMIKNKQETMVCEDHLNIIKDYEESIEKDSTEEVIEKDSTEEVIENIQATNNKKRQKTKE